jgi:hypothetical protein
MTVLSFLAFGPAVLAGLASLFSDDEPELPHRHQILHG